MFRWDNFGNNKFDFINTKDAHFVGDKDFINLPFAKLDNFWDIYKKTKKTDNSTLTHFQKVVSRYLEMKVKENV